jgi:Cu/Ag efflux protein CusF
MHAITLTLAIALATGSGTALAASHEHEMHHDMSSQAPAAMQQGTGVVKAINEKAGKMQIAHEPIPALEWPAMTMWFELKGHAGHGIKVGDSVRFEMRQGEKKQWVIEKIEKR